MDCSRLCSDGNDQLLENETFPPYSLHVSNNPWHSDFKKASPPFWFEYHFPACDVTYECVLFLDSLSWKLLYALYIEQAQRMEVAFCVRHLFLALLMEFLQRRVRFMSARSICTRLLVLMPLYKFWSKSNRGKARTPPPPSPTPTFWLYRVSGMWKIYDVSPEV